MQFVVYLDTALGFNKSLKGMEGSIHKDNFPRVKNARMLYLNNWGFFFAYPQIFDQAHENKSMLIISTTFIYYKEIIIEIIGLCCHIQWPL